MDANAKQSCNERLRVLIFPYLGHAHVFPFLELAKGLAKKNFHIFFYSTPIILESVKQSLSKHKESSSSSSMSIDLVELHLPPQHDLPPHYHTTKNIPPHLMPTLFKAFQMSRSSFSDILRDLEPHLLVYDVMQPWSAKTAAALGIPSVHFSVIGATTLSFGHHCHVHSQSWVSFPYKAVFLREFEAREMTAGVGETNIVEDQEEGFLYGVFPLSRDMVLVKGCRGIEGKYIDYLSTLCQKKIVPTGPLITFAADNQEPDSEIINWLSDKRECSTLYISFGTEIYLSPAKIGEIAKGLELSGVNFIWVARAPVGSEVSIDDALPEGFLQRMEQRGLIVRSWAPQAAILAHPSVGGYMSHCGWSSVIESLYFGVPLVALPFKYDHPTNARLVVELGVGVEVERDEDGQFDGDGVATAIKEVINAEESGERFRSKARELSEKMKVEEEEAFNEIAQELSRICATK